MPVHSQNYSKQKVIFIGSRVMDHIMGSKDFNSFQTIYLKQFHDEDRRGKNLVRDYHFVSHSRSFEVLCTNRFDQKPIIAYDPELIIFYKTVLLPKVFYQADSDEARHNILVNSQKEGPGKGYFLMYHFLKNLFTKIQPHVFVYKPIPKVEIDPMQTLCPFDGILSELSIQSYDSLDMFKTLPENIHRVDSQKVSIEAAIIDAFRSLNKTPDFF